MYRPCNAGTSYQHGCASLGENTMEKETYVDDSIQDSEDSATYTFPATSSDVPKNARTSDSYIMVNVCKLFDFQINMEAQKQDVFHGWSKGSEALRTLIEHSIRIKAADALRSAMAEIFGEKVEDIRGSYTAYAQRLSKDPEKLRKLKAVMFEWTWEGKVSKPKTLESQLADTIKSIGTLIEKVKSGKIVKGSEIAKAAKAELLALQAKRESLEAQLADTTEDLDELFD
jgi:hypothetical protein